MKRLLFFSNLYPNSLFPQQGAFNCQLVRALSEFYEITVVSPIPWKFKKNNNHMTTDPGCDFAATYYPTYWYPPKVLRILYGFFMFASVRRCVEKLHQRKQFEIVLGTWLYPDAWVAAQFAKKFRLPLFIKVHGTDVNRLKRGTILTNFSLSGTIHAKAVICVSDALKNKLISLGVNPGLCNVVYNGINEEIFYKMEKTAVRRQLSLSGPGPYLLFVGNLKKEKGLSELTSAFCELARIYQDMTLIVAGTGSYKENMVQTLNREGLLNRVRFVGSINIKEVALWMNAADLLCLPSYMEGVPNVILEALACDLPIVASNVGGIPEIAEKDERLRLTLPGDTLSLKNEIQAVVNMPCFGVSRYPVKSWRENAKQLVKIMS